MLSKRILDLWLKYLKGQFILMAAIGFLTFLFAKMIGLPYPLILAAVAAIGEAIPRFGPILAGVPAAIVALIFGSSILNIENWQFAVLVIAVYWLIQQLENWLIQPKIIGDAVDIHPLVALVGMTFAGSVFGIPGMLLAIPVMATVREIVHYYFYEDHHLPSNDAQKGSDTDAG